MAEYKADEGKLKEVCSILKAVLTSFGGELPMNQIESEYNTVVGSNIPYRELKHATLASFLQSIPSVLKLQNRGGKLVATVVNDENIDLILQQVRQQNNSKYNKMVQKKKRTDYTTRQLHANPNTQLYHNTRWQTNSNWQNAPWRTPTIPTRPKLFNTQPSPPQAQCRPVQPHPPPGFQATRNIAPPPGFQANSSHQPSGSHVTSTHRVITQQQPSVSQATTSENTRSKAPATEKTHGKKSFKQQLIETVRELEAKQGKTGDSRIQPQFKTVACGKMMEWCSVIIIGEMRVSTYPDLSASQEEAEEAAAKKALQMLPQLAKKKQLPTTTDYRVSIHRVKQLLKERSPNKRFWWEPLRDMYCDVYQERLPQDWVSTVKDRSNTGLVLDNPCVDKWTVALVEESQASSSPKPQDTPTHKQHQEPPHSSSPSPQNEKTEKRYPNPAAQKPTLPPLNLPATPTWDVYITCVEDDNTLQLLLVGEEYNGTYNELVTEMELYYMEEKNQQPVKEPMVGEIYVASHEESWHRVELVEVQGEEAKVKFVDHGDMEAIPLANLYYLEKRFFSLPPQAVQCCLAGLEDAPHEAAFQVLMEILPMGKTLVARVQRRQEPYAVVLFDTSTDDDINLNEKVVESLAKHLVEPSLPPVGGLVEVYLTHATSDGTLYIQVESKTYKILEDLLKIAKRRTEEMLGEKVQVDLTKLYLARFSKDGEWYRAAPRSAVDPNGQALPCCLHNVPINPELRWTVQACERLLDLATPDTPLLLKVVDEGTVSRPPSVQLFKRLLPQNELVSINDTLGIDTKLFGSEGDSNNNSVEKVVVVSQFRSQQSSCTSGVSSQSLPSESPSVGPDSFPPCSPLSLNDIPDVGSYFDVFVTFAANPNHFAVQPWKMGKRFDDLCESMQNYYRNPANLKHVEAIESGQYCALMHSDDTWYRAKVEMVMNGSVAGVFVDFGDRFFSTLEKVQPLTPAFCNIPCLAIKAELYGIQAANKDWSPEDACKFRELAGNRNLVSTISNKQLTSDGSLFLSLVLIDTCDKTVDVYINQLLVDECRAVNSK